MRNACPALRTTARLGVVSPPNEQRDADEALVTDDRDLC
jgi:hypothetical protein